MTMREREQMRRDIHEAFEFLRFVIKNPSALKKIRNNTEIRILPAASGRSLAQYPLYKKTQNFTAETVFRSL